MKKLTDLKTLFIVVAVLEFFYFVSAMLPPGMIRPLTGWNLNVDGQWITKLIGLALVTQAYIAWIFRKNPPANVAKGLAFYQIASATMDWVMWLLLKENGIFDNPLAKTTVIIAIVSHYIIGLLLIAGIQNNRQL